jgi:hypothetical protein
MLDRPEAMLRIDGLAMRAAWGVKHLDVATCRSYSPSKTDYSRMTLNLALWKDLP